MTDAAAFPPADWQTPDGRVRLYRGDCLGVLAAVPAGAIDAVVTDPPYSARTHAAGAAVAGLTRTGRGTDGQPRQPLGYAAWDADQVRAFVAAAHRACSGWLACMADWTLAPVYADAMKAAGRYVFAPLPYYAPGSRVRLSGDGPSSWTDWIVVSRTTAQHRWGTLPGGYTPGPGYGKKEHMGGKPVGLMFDLVRDYSRPGQLVCDPCLGPGTAAVACLRAGRPFVGVEADPATFARAVERVERELAQPTLFGAAVA